MGKLHPHQNTLKAKETEESKKQINCASNVVTCGCFISKSPLTCYMTSGWKKIEGQQFRLLGISHKRPMKLGEEIRSYGSAGKPESMRLTKMAALARENGFYARVLPLPADTVLGRQRWGLYIRPKAKYSWDSRFNGTAIDDGVVMELDRPKEWSADVLSRNKRREGQLKNWREGRNKAFSQMKRKFKKAEKSFTNHWGSAEDKLNWRLEANMFGKPTSISEKEIRLNEKYADENIDAIDSINEYMTGREVGYRGIDDHQGKEMRQPNGLSVWWEQYADARLTPSTLVREERFFPTEKGGQVLVPSTVGTLIYDRSLKAARKRQ